MIPVIDAWSPEGLRLEELRYNLQGFDGKGHPIPQEMQEKARKEFYTHVFVGRFEVHRKPRGEGWTDDLYRLVIAYNAHGEEIYREEVHGTERFDPEVKNKLGQKGAYLPVAPTDDLVNEAVERAKAKLQ